ncbi:MAG: hypothetical protein WED10_01825 [Brumimicrobium sp.]
MCKSLLLKIILSMGIIFQFSQNIRSQVEFDIYAGGNYSFFMQGERPMDPYFKNKEANSVDRSQKFKMRGAVGTKISYILSPRLTVGLDLGLNSRTANAKFYNHITLSANPPITEILVHFPDQVETYSARLGVQLSWFAIDQKLFINTGLYNDFIFKSNSSHTSSSDHTNDENYMFDQHLFTDVEIIEYDPIRNLSGLLGLGVRFNRFDTALNYYIGISPVNVKTGTNLYQQTLELRLSYCLNRQ